MPEYTFLNIDTCEEHTDLMTIAEKEEYLARHPNVQQVIVKAPSIGDSIRLGLKKPDSEFRDRLKDIKKHHSRGFTKSTINTF